MSTRTSRSRRAHPAPGLFLAVSLLGVFGAEVADPSPVVACSCAQPGDGANVFDAQASVFTGTAGERRERGIPVQVDRWFRGAGAAPVVWLANGSFNGVPGVGNSCGVDPPAAGSSWVWAAYRAEDGDFGTGMCAPAGDLQTREGRALLARAEATFGRGGPVPPDAATDPTDPVSPAAAAPERDPAGEARDRTALLILAILVGGSAVMFRGAVLIARRSNRPR